MIPSVIEGEEWRPVRGRVAGFPYQVSSHGRIWSVPRTLESKPGVLREAGHQLIKQRIARDGYVRVNLSKDRVRLTLSVHSLVAEAFLGCKPIGLQINHIDGVKTNNHLSNLEFVTARENCKHADRLRLRGAYKLTECDVRAIRSLRHRFGLTQRLLSRMFMVSGVTICRVLSRKAWPHVA